MKSVLVLGGDGYLGWPTAMMFSANGYEVTVVDSYFRRNSLAELNVALLYEVPTLQDRAALWYEHSGKEIKVVIGDVSDPNVLRSLFNGAAKYAWAVNPEFTGVPSVVIHYAEQPSAPYSQLDHRRADFTLVNNLRVTNNLMWAIRDYAKETHIIKLGTMGEYGTPDIDIEEGWINIEHKGRSDKFLFPRQASSLYHTTKIMDTDLLWFGVRTWGLKVTDLMQGPVYGIETNESKVDPALRTIFNYDEVFGTVINRFLVQAVSGHPLTVYGKGGQTRGYLNIRDTMQCVFRSAETPPAAGELRIFNQIMETFNVLELAEATQRVARTRGHNVEIMNVTNPRKEREEHYYNPTYQGLVDLGVKPHYLTDMALSEMFEIIEGYAENIDTARIMPTIKW